MHLQDIFFQNHPPHPSEVKWSAPYEQGLKKLLYQATDGTDNQSLTRFFSKKQLIIIISKMRECFVKIFNIKKRVERMKGSRICLVEIHCLKS